MTKYLIIFIILFLSEIGYIKYALFKNIKDNPNHRSSHDTPTVRGGGIVIFLSVILYIVFYQPKDLEIYLFIISLFLVALISFLDDIITLSSKLRLIVHLLAFMIVFYSFGIVDELSIYNLFLVLILLTFSIGYLNIYNFMDGINGITFSNALVSFSTLFYLNMCFLDFSDSKLLIILIIATLVFGFFNFRKKALCFAGDIGSISIGFSLLYFVLKFYLLTKDITIFLIFSVYLLDGGWTIIERLYRKENIFKPHKKHLYQLAVNDFGYSHLKIATIYFLIQLMINIFACMLIINKFNNNYTIIGFFIILSIIYITVKHKLLKSLK